MQLSIKMRKKKKIDQIYSFWYVKHEPNFFFMCLFIVLVFTLFPFTTKSIDITIIKETKNNNISNQI